MRVGCRVRFSNVGLCAFASAALLALAAGQASALTTPECLAKKVKEWGKLRKCQAVEQGKALRGLSSDVAKCAAKHQAKLAAIDGLATVAAVACRFGDNGDGTVTDYDSGLQWEQKTDDDGPHDRDLMYEWSWGIYNFNYTSKDGSLFTGFIERFNDCTSTDNGITQTGGFGGHCDWRIPTLVELLSMADMTVPGCETLDGNCINEAMFGPAPETTPNAPQYWSSTVFPESVDYPNWAWLVDFRFAFPGITTRNSSSHARAVRTAF